MTALQLNAPVELLFVDLAAQENLKPQFLQMNPNHRVPVLEDGDFRLWESRAIMQYLADKTPGQVIYPTEVRARAAREGPGDAVRKSAEMV
jgi:glutathione S-transferase